MNKIMKISKWTITIIKILSVSIPLIVLFPWVFIDTVLIQGLLKGGYIAQPVLINESIGVVELWKIQWTFLNKSIAVASDIISMLPIYISLFILKSIFTSYTNGNIFTTDNAMRYKKLGSLFFVYGLIFLPLSETVKILALTIENEPGKKILAIGFGTPSIEALFCGLIVFLVSLVMQEASKINDENSYTV